MSSLWQLRTVNMKPAFGGDDPIQVEFNLSKNCSRTQPQWYVQLTNVNTTWASPTRKHKKKTKLTISMRTLLEPPTDITARQQKKLKGIKIEEYMDMRSRSGSRHMHNVPWIISSLRFRELEMSRFWVKSGQAKHLKQSCIEYKKD